MLMILCLKILRVVKFTLGNKNDIPHTVNCQRVLFLQCDVKKVITVASILTYLTELENI